MATHIFGQASKLVRTKVTFKHVLADFGLALKATWNICIMT